MSYTAYNRTALKAELMRDEGKRYTPYTDSVGVLTVGVGHNLNEALPEEVIDLLLDRDIDRAEEALDHIEPRWRLLMVKEPARARALLNMAFNLGEARLRAFVRMWEVIRRAIDTAEPVFWQEAKKHALDSTWAKQVGLRATRIGKILETGSL